MQKDKIQVGKKYRVDTTGEDLNWFLHGAVITVTDLYEKSTVRATGPARRDNCGGTRCKKGDIIDGYVYASQLEETEPETINYNISIVDNNTTIVLQKRLSVEEVHAFLKAVGV